MSVARFLADLRANHRVPHTLTCALLGVSLAWFYKWWKRPTVMARPMVCSPGGTGAGTRWTGP